MTGILLLDKDEGWTSQDAVAKLRGILRERRIGHAGTLDPLATGLLVILVGRATRAAEFAEAGTKEYVAAFRPGLTTDTQDITGNLLSQSTVLPTEQEVRELLPRFTGPLLQLPPLYSALKVNGERLYRIARRGGTAECAPRPITIHELEYLGCENGDHLLRVRCSKGTYIRTLCHDLGQALGCGGCMAALRRTAVGPFRVEDARRIGGLTREEGLRRLLPVDTLFSDLPQYILSPEQEKRCRCGSPFPTQMAPGDYRFVSQTGEFLALGQCRDGEASARKSFFEVN